MTFSQIWAINNSLARDALNTYVNTILNISIVPMNYSLMNFRMHLEPNLSYLKDYAGKNF